MGPSRGLMQLANILKVPLVSNPVVCFWFSIYVSVMLHVYTYIYTSRYIYI